MHNQVHQRECYKIINTTIQKIKDIDLDLVAEFIFNGQQDSDSNHSIITTILGRLND